MVTGAWLKEQCTIVISVSIFSACRNQLRLYCIHMHTVMLSTPLSPSKDYACWVYSLLPMAKSIYQTHHHLYFSQWEDMGARQCLTELAWGCIVQMELKISMYRSPLNTHFWSFIHCFMSRITLHTPCCGVFTVTGDPLVAPIQVTSSHLISLQWTFW